MSQSYRSLVVAFQWDDDFFLPHPTRCVKVIEAVIYGVGARVLFRDLDQGVLLVRLEESQLCEQCHVASFAARVRAMYSASVDDNATVGCFFEHQLTGPPFNMKIKPEGDFREQER